MADYLLFRVDTGSKLVLLGDGCFYFFGGITNDKNRGKVRGKLTGGSLPVR